MMGQTIAKGWLQTVPPTKDTRIALGQADYLPPGTQGIPTTMVDNHGQCR